MANNNSCSRNRRNATSLYTEKKKHEGLKGRGEDAHGLDERNYRIYGASCDRWMEPPRAQGSPAHEWRIPLGVGAARADIYMPSGGTRRIRLPGKQTRPTDKRAAMEGSAISAGGLFIPRRRERGRTAMWTCRTKEVTAGSTAVEPEPSYARGGRPAPVGQRHRGQGLRGPPAAREG